MPYKFVIAAVFVCSVFTGCSKDGDNPAAPAQQLSAEDAILPLAAGNYWIYQTTRTEDGQMTISYDTLMATGPQVINGSNWYTVGYTGDESSMQSFRNTATGTAVYAKNTESLMFKYPAAAGDSLAAITGDGLLLGQVLATDEGVNVQAGIFTCYVYSYLEGHGEELKWYIAPRAGIVMSLYHFELTSPQYPNGHVVDEVRELIGYHLEN